MRRCSNYPVIARRFSDAAIRFPPLRFSLPISLVCSDRGTLSGIIARPRAVAIPSQGEGQLSTLVSIRDKLRRGKKLESWEQEYYRRNKDRVDLKKRYSAQELAEQERLKKLLGD